MSAVQTNRSFVIATAQEVLPKFGLAFLVDDQGTTWTVTRSTEGPGLQALRAGQGVELTLNHFTALSFVRTYHPHT